MVRDSDPHRLKIQRRGKSHSAALFLSRIQFKYRSISIVTVSRYNTFYAFFLKAFIAISKHRRPTTTSAPYMIFFQEAMPSFRFSG